MDVYIKYVGKKPWTVDVLGGTGTIWNGNGDIQPVPEAVAQKLVAHPDQWEVVSLKEALTVVQAEPKPKAKSKAKPAPFEA